MAPLEAAAEGTVFWSSVMAGVVFLAHWQVWAAVAAYVVGMLAYLLGVGLMMAKSQTSMGVGCVFHTIAGPFVQGVMLAFMVAFLLPLMLGGSSASGVSTVLSIWWPLVKTSAIVVVGVTLLCFAPLVGKIIADSVGIQTFLEGVIIFRLLSDSVVEEVLSEAGVTGKVFPGFWASIGFLAISAVLVWLLTMGLALAVGLVAERRGRDDILELTGMTVAPALSVLGGLVPLFMYSSHVRLGLQHLLWL